LSALNRTWHPLSLWLVLLGGFALRLYHLGVQSLWYDETVSAHLASQNMPRLIAHTAGDIHPPGYYLLLHVWTRLAGNSEFTLAYASLAFGVLLIPLSYALARTLFGRSAAWWTALLVAISPFNIWYSQEVRMYTLAAALGLVTLWCALGLLRARPPLYAYSIGYVLSAAAGLYVLYYFGFLLIILNGLVVAGLLWRRQAARLRTWLLAQAAVLIAYLPWLFIAWRQATHPPVPPWRGFIPLSDVLLESWTALSLGQSVRPGQIWPTLLLSGILFVLGLLTATDRPADRQASRSGIPAAYAVLLLVGYTFGPLILIYLISLKVPLYHVRYLFTYAPPFYILLAAGLVWLSRRAWPLPLAAALALVAGAAFSVYELHTNPRYAADDFRSAVRFIAERWRPGDAVLINAGYAYPAFLYYYDGPIAGRVRLRDYTPSQETGSLTQKQPLLLTTGTIDGDPQLGWGDPDSDFYATDRAESAAALARVAQTFHRVWVLRVYDTVIDPDGFVREWLAANMTPFEDQLFSGESNMRVQGFMSITQPPPPRLQPVELEEGYILLGWDFQPNAQAGQPLDVVLWWQVSPSGAAEGQRSAQPYAVSLKLWGPNKSTPGSDIFLAAQQDEWPVGSLLFTPSWPPGSLIRHPMRLRLPADLPNGQYRLELEMYDPSRMRPLERRDGQGHIIPLGIVSLSPSE